jgi:hypothetical protein
MSVLYSLLLETCAAVVVLTFGVTVSASACECRTIPPAEALQKSAVVFHGVVIQIEHLHALEAPDPVTGKSRRWIPELDDLIVVTFKVDASWKGRVTPIMKVYSVVRPSMCDGYEFSIAKEYLVYAVGPPNSEHIAPEERDVVNRFKKEPVYGIPACPPPILAGALDAATAVLGKGQIMREQN